MEQPDKSWIRVDFVPYDELREELVSQSRTSAVSPTAAASAIAPSGGSLQSSAGVQARTGSSKAS
jgi:hypothetical protein